MRLVLVVQRYLTGISGGAEGFARSIATRLATRGHTIDVATSCARSYVDWRNELQPGVEMDEGVRVHRLPVERTRDTALFAALSDRIYPRGGRIAPHLAREWMRQQGPWMPQLAPWVADHTARADVAVFVTALYATAWLGLPAARCPTLLHPTVHDEPAMRLPVFDQLFRIPDGFGFLTEEEEAFVRRRFRVATPGVVLGPGVGPPAGGDPAAFRRAHHLGDRPYLLYLGRVDPGKGIDDLLEAYATLRRRRRASAPLLVLAGETVGPIRRAPGVVMTGFVDARMRDAALRGAVALVQPSRFESFSLSVVEAWACGVPAIVQRRSAVLHGQVTRSRGGIAYSDAREFALAASALVDDAPLRRTLGEAGKAYVAERYQWGRVLDRYESFLSTVAAARAMAVS